MTPKVVVGDIPCAPDKVLKNVCQFCHTNPPQHGAPFPLVTYGNIQSELDGRPIYYWMEKFVTAGIMPLDPVEITDPDRAILLQWLRDGAPPREVGQVCDGDGGVIVPDTGTPVDSAPPEDTAPDALEGIEPSDWVDAGEAKEAAQQADAMTEGDGEMDADEREGD